MQDIYSPKPKVILLVGNFGSGKTEIAVNYALQLASRYPDVAIVDLDIVKPYFRCREAKEIMERKRVRVIIPEGDRRYADLPIVVPEVKGIISQPRGYTILDVGGEDTGARVLSYLSEAFEVLKEYEFWMVVNRNRPFTTDLNGTMKVLRAIEKSSGLKTTGVISNAHFQEETDIETILSGYELTTEVAKEVGVPVIFVTAPEILVENVREAIPVPILPIRRTLLPPHLKHLAISL